MSANYLGSVGTVLAQSRLHLIDLTGKHLLQVVVMWVTGQFNPFHPLSDATKPVNLRAMTEVSLLHLVQRLSSSNKPKCNLQVRTRTLMTPLLADFTKVAWSGQAASIKNGFADPRRSRIGFCYFLVFKTFFVCGVGMVLQ